MKKKVVDVHSSREINLVDVPSVQSSLCDVHPLTSQLASRPPAARKAFIQSFSEKSFLLWQFHALGADDNVFQEEPVQRIPGTYNSLNAEDASSLVALLADGLGGDLMQQQLVLARAWNAACPEQPLQVALQHGETIADLGEHDSGQEMDEHVEGDGSVVSLPVVPLTRTSSASASIQQAAIERKLKKFFGMLLKHDKSLTIDSNVFALNISRNVDYGSNITNIVSNLRSLSISQCIQKLATSLETLEYLDYVSSSNCLLCNAFFGLIYIKEAIRFHNDLWPGIVGLLRPEPSANQRRFIPFDLYPIDIVRIMLSPVKNETRLFKSELNKHCKITKASSSIKAAIQVAVLVSHFGLGACLCTAGTYPLVMTWFRDSTASTVRGLLDELDPQKVDDAKQWLETHYREVFSGVFANLHTVLENDFKQITAWIVNSGFE
jgi:hypothetical protein